MASKVIYKKTDAGFEVEFPFALLSSFKETFKSAKWDVKKKVWLVGVRSEARLAQFAKECGPALDAVEALDEAEMAPDELEKLRTALEEVERSLRGRAAEIAAKKNYVERLEELIAVLKVKRVELSAKEKLLTDLEAKHSGLALAVTAEKARIDQMLSKVIDLADLKGKTLGKFALNHDKVGATAHDLWREARSKYVEAQRRLKEAGMRLVAIDYIVDANFNRPERDGIKFIPANAWYEVKEIKEDMSD